MARQSVTPTWGEPIDIKGYTADYTVPVQTGWDAARLSVVAFVANYDAEDKNNCRVLNAEEAKVPYEGVAGIESAVAKPMHVSWDGSTLMVKDGFSRLTVCDMSGRQVYSATAPRFPQPRILHCHNRLRQRTEGDEAYGRLIML